MWRVDENPNPCTNLDEILHAHPHLSKEGFGASLTPHFPPMPGGPKILKVEGHIFWKLLTKEKMFGWLQINLGSAGYLS